MAYSLCFGQHYVAPDSINYYKQIEEYIKNTPNFYSDSSEGGIIKSVKRELNILSPRLYPHGDIRIASKAIYEYADDYNKKNLYRSPNSGASPEWDCLGPNDNPTEGFKYASDCIGVGQMHRITFDPNYDAVTNQTIYAASSFGGLWKTINRGDNWSICGTDQGLPISSVADIAISHQHTNILFIGTGQADVYNPEYNNLIAKNPIFSTGTYRSTDGGDTWESINSGIKSASENLLEAQVTRSLKISPINENLLYMATSNGLFKTINATGSADWQQSFPGENYDDYDYRGVELKPTNDDVVYVSGKFVYRSIDGGVNWDKLDFPLNSNFTSIRCNIAVTPANHDNLYAYFIGEETVGSNTIIKAYVYYFDGANYYPLDSFLDGGGQNVVDPSWNAITVSPINENKVYYGRTKVRYINDSGTLTNPLISEIGYWTSGFHADVHDLVFEPISTDPRLYCANHGGISIREYPSSSTWIRKNNGISNALLFNVGYSPNNPEIKTISNQDNGTTLYRNWGSNSEWKTLNQIGDGYFTQIDAYDNDIV